MKLTLQNMRKGIRYLKHYGWKEFRIRLKEMQEPDEIRYHEWFAHHCAGKEVLQQERETVKKWKNMPLLSILIADANMPEGKTFSVMNDRKAGNVSGDESAEDLQQFAGTSFWQTISSILEQSYPNWEICVAGTLDKAFLRVKGEYIIPMISDDMLAPNALYEMARTIVLPESIVQSGVHWETYLSKWGEATGAGWSESGEPDIIYADEDFVSKDLSEHGSPKLKPDFNPDFLRSNNYIGHPAAIRTELAKAAGGFCNGDAVAAEYDFMLRCVEKARRIVHIPQILYHNRERGDMLSDGGNSELEALQAHLDRMGTTGKAEMTACSGIYRVKYTLTGHPLVSIVIPNKDETDTLDQCLKSIAKSSYRNYEVIIVENNSEKDETFAYYEEIGKRENIRVVSWENQTGFNYSAINNYGVRFARGEYLVLLNNDVEILSADWLEELLGHCMRPEVGIAGVRLYYPDNTIQHAGIVVGIGGAARGVAANMMVGASRTDKGYMCRAGLQADFSAMTAACLMIRRDVFDEAGGFNEELAVAFNDVDLCLKVRKAGYLIVYVPCVEAYHYESKSRGQEDSEEKIRRFQREIEYMRTKWNDILRYGDPNYNPNLSRVKCNYSLNGIR